MLVDSASCYALNGSTPQRSNTPTRQHANTSTLQRPTPQYRNRLDKRARRALQGARLDAIANLRVALDARAGGLDANTLREGPSAPWGLSAQAQAEP